MQCNGNYWYFLPFSSIHPSCRAWAKGFPREWWCFCNIMNFKKRKNTSNYALTQYFNHIFCQGQGLCAWGYCAPSCLLCGCANESTIITWFHHVAKVLVIECPLQDTLVPVDVPCGHISFARVDWICRVVVKLQAICVPSNTSCKHKRNTFPLISRMCCHVQFYRLQTRG